MIEVTEMVDTNRLVSDFLARIYRTDISGESRILAA